MPSPRPVLVLFGATGVGKTDSLRYLQEGLGTPIEVISADSMQVYRGMDIGTAKPSIQFRSELPHHLIDIRNPDQQFTLGDFIGGCQDAVSDLHRRAILPVVSGGTAFYLKHLLFGMPEAPVSQPEVRGELEEILSLRGLEYLRRELEAVDPVSAGRIGAGDAYRIIRALEVWRISGRPLSSFSREGRMREDWRVLILGLERPREELYARINTRVEQMFQAGLEDEVAVLVDRGYGPEDPGMRGIGYREFFAAESRAERIELIQRNTRRYAKRQETFFRGLRQTHWNHPGTIKKMIPEIRSWYQG